MNSSYVTVIIPAFNEEHRIRPTLLRIHSYLTSRRYDSEILVVDNASKDGTADVVKRLRASIPNLRLIDASRIQGKGNAVATGIRHSSGKYVLFSDADLSTPIEEVEKLLYRLESDADIAIGSRGLKTSEIIVRQPWLRERGGKIFNLLVRAMVLGTITDTQCGFKCFKRDTIEPIFGRQRIYGYGFDVEALFIARKIGYTIAEVPVRWIDDPRTHVKPVKDAYRMFRDLVRIRFWEVRGVYD